MTRPFVGAGGKNRARKPPRIRLAALLRQAEPSKQESGVRKQESGFGFQRSALGSSRNSMGPPQHSQIFFS